MTQRKYHVKTVLEVPNGMGNGTNRYPLATDVSARSAEDAISKGIEWFKAQGWDGIFRWPEAENVNDGHDYARRSF